MALGERAVLVAELKLDDNLTPGLKKAERGVSHFDSVAGKAGKGLKTLGANMLKLGAAAAVAGAAMAGVAIKSGLSSLAELEDATTAVDGALKATGQTAKVTSQQIATWANDIEASVQAAFDDKAIVAGAATLLRYGKISTKSLRPAMVVMTDLAAKTGDVGSAASKLAKSLADPTKATRVLREVGVTLTKAEEKQIKTLVEAGKLGSAQAIILRKVAAATKGAAAAAKGPYNDALNELSDTAEDVQRSLAEGFLPVIQDVAKFLRTELVKPEAKQAIKDLGKGLADGFKAALDFARSIPWGAIVEAGRGIAGFAKTALGFFNAIPDWAKSILIGGFAVNALSGGMLTSIAGEILFKRGGSPANPLFVADVTGGLGGALGKGGKGLLGTLLSMPVLIGGAILAGTLAAVQTQVIQPGLDAQANANNENATRLLRTGTLAELRKSLDGLRQMPDQLDPLQRALYELNANGVKTHTEALEAAIAAEIASREQKPTPGVDRQGEGISVQRPRGEHAGRISNATRAGIILRVTEKTGKAPTADRVTAILLKTQTTKLQAIKDAVRSGDDVMAQKLAALSDATRSVTAAVNGTTAAVNKWSGFTIPAPVVNTTVTVTGFTVRTLNRKTTVARSINPVDPRLGAVRPT